MFVLFTKLVHCLVAMTKVLFYLSCDFVMFQKQEPITYQIIILHVLFFIFLHYLALKNFV